METPTESKIIKRKPGRPSTNDSRRKEILDKSTECFIKFGFNKTTLDEENISWGSADVLNKEGERYDLKSGFIKKYPHVLTLIFMNEQGNGLIYELKPND